MKKATEQLHTDYMMFNYIVFLDPDEYVRLLDCQCEQECTCDDTEVLRKMLNEEMDA